VKALFCFFNDHDFVVRDVVVLDQKVYGDALSVLLSVSLPVAEKYVNRLELSAM
jgi:hypothetical protein